MRNANFPKEVRRTTTRILGESLMGRLTVEIEYDYSLGPSFEDLNWWHSDIASSAGSFRVGQDPSQAWPAAFGFAVRCASGLVAMKRIN